VPALDYGMASPWLLVRDMRKITSQTTLATIKHILDDETSDNSFFRLVQDVMTGRFRTDGLFESTLNIVVELRAGILDKVG
jgi:hypothetical protein